MICKKTAICLLIGPCGARADDMVLPDDETIPQICYFYLHADIHG